MRWTPLKSRLRSGASTLGSWITFGHPGIAEVMAASGFEWIVIDLEHSVIELRDVATMIRVIEAAGVAPLVRLTSNNPDQAKRVMDAGAHGVLVPMVSSPAAARAAVQAVHYPPMGTRGVGLSRAQSYGDAFQEYVEALPEQAVVIAQIEHGDAVKALPAILQVPGLDATIIGPYPALVKERMSRGYTFIAFGVDFLFLSRSCRAATKTLRT